MPLLSVYNHLMQGLVMMHQTRFDTHKKSELRDVYQNILRLSAEQPLYKLSFDEAAQNFTLGIKNSALSLSCAVKELHIDDDSSVFRSKSLRSDCPEAVSVSVPDGSSPNHVQLPLELELTALSSPQRNEGCFVPSEASELCPGQYNFTIGIEDKLYSFQFRVSEGSVNLELQNKLSDFINKTSIGLTTSVLEDRINRISRLSLSSCAYGSAVSGKPSFTLTDTRWPGNASYGVISHFGLDTISQEANNTQLFINGASYETREHELLYRNCVNLSFHRLPDRPVTISSVTDKGPVIQKVERFIGEYNSLLSFIRTNGSANRLSGRLLTELTAIPGSYAGELAAVGILAPADREGSFSLDLETAYPAAEDGTLERFFLSGDGFVSRTLNKLSAISLNPMDYLDKTIVTYPNHAARKSYSPYTASIYSGLLYNNYC